MWLRSSGLGLGSGPLKFGGHLSLPVRAPGGPEKEAAENNLRRDAAKGIAYNDVVGSRTGRPPRPFWQEVGTQLLREWAGRKVRTPQSSVPDNVREVRFKPDRRKVPQKTYRPDVVVGACTRACAKRANIASQRTRLRAARPDPSLSRKRFAQDDKCVERHRGKGEKVR